MSSPTGTFSAADTQKVFADYTILRAREWVPLLLDAAEGAQLNSNEKKALDLLAQWDFVSDKDSAPAMIFQATLVQMVRNAFEDKLGEQLYGEFIHDRGVDKWLKNIMPLENSPWFDDLNTPAVEDRADFLLESFKEGVKSLEEELGPDPAAWHLGDLLTLTLRSPLSRAVPSLASVFDIGPMSVSGGIIAPYQTSYGFDEPYQVTGGTQARFVVDLSDRRNCRIVNMPGISGNFMSPHYSDQVKMWQDFQFRPLVLYREEADKDAKHHLTLLSR
jgi:penicillin amidase